MHHQRAVQAWLRWQVEVGVRKIVTMNRGYPHQTLAARVDPSDQASVDRFLCEISPEFDRASKAATRRVGPQITDGDRERALARHLGLFGGRMGDFVAPGTAVSVPASSGLGAAGRRDLRPTTSGVTEAGVEWKDEYPLAALFTSVRVNDRSGGTKDVSTAVRICTGRRMFLYEAAQYLCCVYMSTCISGHANV